MFFFIVFVSEDDGKAQEYFEKYFIWECQNSYTFLFIKNEYLLVFLDGSYIDICSELHNSEMRINKELTMFQGYIC